MDEVELITCTFYLPEHILSDHEGQLTAKACSGFWGPKPKGLKGHKEWA